MRAGVFLAGVLLAATGAALRPADQPDGRALLERAAAACSAIKTIEYQEEQLKADAPDSPAMLRATIWQERAAVPDVGYLPGRFTVEGQDLSASPARPLAVSYDGRTLRVMSSREKVIRVLPSPSPFNVGRLMTGERTAGAGWFTQDQPLAQYLKNGDQFHYDGTLDVFGITCNVVRFRLTVTHPAFGSRTSTIRLYIGAEDNLPRGLEAGNVTKRIRIVRLNQDLGRDHVIPTPEGYSEQLATGNEPKIEGLLPLGQVAPDWALRGSDGRLHKLSDYRGKVVLLDFWGTWCAPCIKSMPEIQALHAAFAKRGLAVFGVAVADGEGDPTGFMKRNGYSYTTLLDGDAVAKSYRAVMLPTLYVIGRDGRIAHAEKGYRKDARAELARIIERQLARRLP